MILIFIQEEEQQSEQREQGNFVGKVTLLRIERLFMAFPCSIIEL
jgi:hypothetical protein